MNTQQKQISNDRQLYFSKNINAGAKRAICSRLQLILSDEENAFKFWQDHTAFRLNEARQKQVAREFNKRIQALRIVLHMLTPMQDRIFDAPAMIVKKARVKKPSRKLLAAPIKAQIDGPAPAALTADQVSLLSKFAALIASSENK